jgi:Uma2 family endonuclease
MRPGGAHVAVERKLVTAQELLAMPDDGLRRELIDGEVRTMAPASGGHGFDAGAIHLRLGMHLLQNPIGAALSAETGFVLRRNPDRVRAPDVAVVLYARRPRETIGRGFLEGAPDLVVEVVSPDDTAEEVAEKVSDWLEAGARVVWVAYRGPRIEAHHADGRLQRLGPDDDIDGGEVLPGFRMKVHDLLDPHAR